MKKVTQLLRNKWTLSAASLLVLIQVVGAGVKWG